MGLRFQEQWDLRMIFSEVSAEERAGTRQHLEHYCQFDTLAMVWLVARLEELAR